MLSFKEIEKNCENGFQQYISLGKTTMELTEIMQQNENETDF
jgi:hypothetical protein